MKKIVIGLCVVAVIVFLGILVFKRPGGPSQAAALAPGNSILFINIPNLPMSGFRWTRTALAKIAAEQDVRDFLALPKRRLQENPDANETGDTLTALKPGNVFLSLVPGSTNIPAVIAGVQFWAKRADFDKAVERLRQELPGSADATPTRSEHRGIEILATTHGDFTLLTAATGRWGFLSTDETLLRGAIDRATGNSAGDGLSKNPEFLQVVSQLLDEPDLLLYAKTESAVDALLAAGDAAGAVQIPEQVAELKAIQAAGASWKMDGDLQRDAIYLLRPGTTAPATPLAHRAIELTKPDTMVFLNFQIDFSGFPEWLDTLSEFQPETAALLAPVVDGISKNYGPECAILADWPAENPFPSPLLAVEARNTDSNTATGFLQNLAGTQTIGNRQILVLPTPHSPIATAQNENFLVLGTDPETVAAALDVHSQTLRDAPEFKSAKSALASANVAFAYIDSRTLFERTYSSLLPVIKLTAALMPDLAESIDVSKLPKPETIGQHLPPIVFSQKHSTDGILLESSGPVTMSQFLILAGSVSAAMNNNLLGR